MSITIGRCVLPDPSSVASSGEVVTFSGVFVSSATTAANRAAEAQVREMQLLGMVGNDDEDVWPVIWSSEPRWTGYYLCDGASWNWINDGSGRLAAANWSVTMRRLIDGANALVEIQSLALVRTNAHSLTSVTTSRMFGPFNTNWPVVDGPAITISAVRVSDTEAVIVDQSTVSTPQTLIRTFDVPPDYFYYGSCRIEYLADDNVWYPLTGRMLPTGSQKKWRLSNGVIRFAPNENDTNLVISTPETTPNPGWDDTNVGMTRWTGSTYASVGVFAGNRPPAILSNSPDVVTVTDGLRTLSLSRTNFHATLTSRGVENPGLQHTTNTASTALSTASAGLRSTNNDLNGNRLVLMSTGSTTRDLTNGRMYVTAASTATTVFGIGVELSGSAAASGNTATDLLGQFIGSATHTTRVVKR